MPGPKKENFAWPSIVQLFQLSRSSPQTLMASTVFSSLTLSPCGMYIYICIDMYFHILSLELRFCDELIRSRLVLTVFGLGEKGLAAKVRLTFMG